MQTLKRQGGDEVARAALLLDGIALQDPQKRGRIVEFGALATAAAILATSAFTVETVSTVEWRVG